MSETRWAIYCPETKTFEGLYGAVITFDTEGAANTNLSYFDASEKTGRQVVRVAVPVEAAPAPDDTADWPWWWITWDEDDGIASIPSRTEISHHGYQVHDGKIWNVTLRTQYPTEPTDAEAIRLIEEACGIELPKPEEPRWWFWNENAWMESATDALGIRRDPLGRWTVRVFGTTADRDAKRGALIVAAKAADKPEDQP